MAYQYSGKTRDLQGIPFSREEMAAKIAYFRDAENQINGGPATAVPIYLIAPITRNSKAGGCGTYSGYQWHLRTKTPKCRECKDALKIYHRGYRARKKVAA